MWEKLWSRKRAYHVVFLEAGTPTLAGHDVLTDLARFCRAHESTAVHNRVTGTMDPIASAKLDGRREVWLRIQGHLDLDNEALNRMRARSEQQQ